MIPLKKQLSIVVPAFNEGSKLAKTLNEILEIVPMLDDYELIVVDDGSSDNTAEVAQQFVSARPGLVTLIRHETNRGVGAAYLNGLAVARHPFLTLIPGDNAFGTEGVRRLFALVGEAEMIVSYRENPGERTFLRRWLSRLGTLLVWGVTGKRIRDAHSMYVFPVALARKLEVSSGYGYHVESLCRLLLMVSSFREVPVNLNPKPDASSGVMKRKTLMNLAWTMARLYLLRLSGRLVNKS